MNETHKTLYRERIASHMHQYPPLSWADLKKCLLETVGEVIGNKKRHRKDVKGLPCKKWFDDQCKNARKKLKGLTGDAYICAAKEYHVLVQKKK